MLTVPLAGTVLDPHVGGDVSDRDNDESICRWGRVLAFDPPATIALGWDIGPDWGSVRAGLDAPDCWPVHLGRYAALTRAPEAP